MFSAGCDPEVLLKNNESYVISQNYLYGTKDNPQLLTKGGNLQCDNALAEFAIDPAYSKIEYLKNIRNAIIELKSILPSDIIIDIVPSAVFNLNELWHPDCFEFGCSRDFNAWTGEINEFDESVTKETLRSAGGHEHIGFIKDSGNDFLLDWEGQRNIVKVLDYIKGSMSILLDNNKEAIERRKLYGKPGCYRPTDYGVEYRTLSNFWLKSPKLVELMYETTEDCLAIVRENKYEELNYKIGGELIQDIILKGNVDMADIILNTIIKDYVRPETWELFKECENNINSFNFEKEWEI